jgi:hypothetical protein
MQVLPKPTPGIGEGHAELPNLTVGPLGRRREGLALASADVFPGAVGCVELHPGNGAGA